MSYRLFLFSLLSVHLVRLITVRTVMAFHYNFIASYIRAVHERLIVNSDIIEPHQTFLAENGCKEINRIC
jgi:hypothetical protein